MFNPSISVEDKTYTGSTFPTNMFPASWSFKVLICLNHSLISGVCEAHQVVDQQQGAKGKYPTPDIPTFVGLQKDWPDGNGIRNPLDETTFFIQCDNTVSPDTYAGSAPSSWNAEPSNNLRSCRLRDSKFAFSNLLMIALKSMRRASFLKSSFGFPRKVYICPLLPLIDILRGFARDFMMSISSKKSTRDRQLELYAEGEILITLKGRRISGEWFVRRFS